MCGVSAVSLLWTSLGLALGVLRLLFKSILWVFQSGKRNKIPPIRDPLLLEPATVLALKIRTRKVKSETVVRAYVDRIRLVNPVLNAVVEDRFEDALKEAREVDRHILNSGRTPEQLLQEKPFLGVPFTSKEAIAIEGLSMTSGVVSRKGEKASEDSAAVFLMRSAGAIPLCVTNVAEMCSWWDASNKLFGRTKNPYDLDRTPGGSSGGESALIAAAGSMVGLGNDIGGSIRDPAFCCGIFGHKPTRKIVSNRGQFPTTYETELEQFNVTGPMCRYAADLQPVLKVLANNNAIKLRLDQKVDMKKLKVYYTEDYTNHPLSPAMSSEISLAVRKVVHQLSKTYGIPSQRVTLPALSKSWSIFRTKINAAKIPESCTKSAGQVKITLWLEFLKWCLRLSNHTLHYLVHHQAVVKLFKSDWMKATNASNHELFAQLTRDFQDLLSNDGVFIYPTNSQPATYHKEQLLYYTSSGFTCIFNLLGLPVTQCPTGMSWQGVPIGVQVVSNLFNDRLTLAVAREIEVLYGGWNSPALIL